MVRLLIINGASGVGKTTVASLVSARIEGLNWIHPDGQLDIASMNSEQILRAALERVDSRRPTSIAMIDCQIRGSHARHVLSEAPDIALINVLLACTRGERERRLRQRSNAQHDFARIEAWSSVLVEDAVGEGDLIIDTTVQNPENVASQIVEVTNKWAPGSGA